MVDNVVGNKHFVEVSNREIEDKLALVERMLDMDLVAKLAMEVVMVSYLGLVCKLVVEQRPVLLLANIIDSELQ